MEVARAVYDRASAALLLSGIRPSRLVVNRTCGAEHVIGQLPHSGEARHRIGVRGGAPSASVSAAEKTRGPCRMAVTCTSGRPTSS